MPITQINVPAGAFPDEAIGALLIELSGFYAATLYPEAASPPVERVRAFVNEVRPQVWASGGKLVSEGGADAPYFTCLVLKGRAIEQHHALIAGFSELIAKHLGCDKAQVRGQVVTIEPDNWGIGGVPASIVRQAEIAARGGS